MVRALLPRATRSGLGGLKPSQLSRGLVPADGENQRGWRGPLAGCGCRSAIGRSSFGGATKALSRTRTEKEGEAEKTGQRTDGSRHGGGDERGFAEDAVRYDVVRACGGAGARDGTGRVGGVVAVR